MSGPSTMLSPQKVIELAKAPTVAYGEKNWAAVRSSITSDFVYDEVATGRRVQGADQVLAAWEGWATAFPDSRATFHSAQASGNAVTLEVTWTGTHRGPLQTPAGPIPPTGKAIDVRACIIMEIRDDRASAQRHYFDMATLLRQLGVSS